MKKHHNGSKKIIVLIVLIMLCLIVGIVAFLYLKKERIDNKINDVNNHYSEIVITNKKSNIYIYNNDEYIKVGTI